MLAAGVIEPVDHSDWATPLVPVRKADGGLRICADYKITLNPVLLVDRFPLPRIEDLLPLYLTCDASARGIGGVLTQRSASTADGGAGGAGAGRERPVIYVSRALTDAEKNYSQIDREALAIVFCLGKLHQNEIYEELGCIMWGHRVVIPENCRSKVLLQLHESHMGIVKTKATARSYVWWPGIDEAVEALCRACPACAAEADAPPRHAPSPWPWPAAPWSRLHVDFLGPIFNKTYLVIIDAKTKWLEVFQVPSTAATSTIHKLSELFARWGLPKQLVSDNGPPFTSKEFSEFLRGCGIAHFFTAPYHPASNGAAENAVRTIKKVIKKAIRLNLDVHLFLNTFLLHYRNTEHCTTGESPAALMLGRRLRTKLDILRPNVENRVSIVQARQAESRGQPGDNRELHAGEEVWYRNYQGTTRWLPGEVSQKIGGTDYKVLDGLGRENHRHIDQLKRRSRSSLICPNSPLSDKQDENRLSIPSTTMNEAGPEETRPPSQEPAGTTSTTQPPSNEREPSAGGAASAPSPPAPEPPQSRPIRQCRLNPPKYKL
ncbi:uncharacterized protein K02A2.6-like [Ostrinia nubilalis]|uniref:uncharacterized protein K02A2.6-like n=1 Tax=Ostrinia nubilalis TaxID=29057 RepID=UPI00308267DB